MFVEKGRVAAKVVDIRDGENERAHGGGKKRYEYMEQISFSQSRSLNGVSSQWMWSSKSCNGQEPGKFS
jgi:hypothetical protein